MFSLVAAALITNSPLDNLAGIESDVPDPGPVTKPPVAPVKRFVSQENPCSITLGPSDELVK